MALKAFEGFDHYGQGTDIFLRTGALQWSQGGYTDTLALVAPGRGGFGKALQFSFTVNAFHQPSSGLYATFNSNYGAALFAFALEFGANTAGFLIGLIDPLAGDAPQVTLGLDPASGTITLYSGSYTGTVLATSEPNAFNGAVYQMYEVSASIAATGGTLAVRVANQQVLTYSGDTKSTANASFGGILLQGESTNYLTTGSVLIDDFRYNDTATGPGAYPCNSWMGDLRVAPLFPVGNGSVAWTPLANTNWQEVSETAFDGDTSYNSTSTNGATDWFNFGTLAAVIDEIVAVQIVGAYRETDAGGHTIAHQISAGGTAHAGATLAIGTGYQFFSDIWPVNPTTDISWSLADVNAMQAGYEEVS
jgi:hypothetical protein